MAKTIEIHCGKCHHYSHQEGGSCPVSECRCVSPSPCDCGSIMFHDQLTIGRIPV